MHFFASLFFLLLTILLTFAYLAFGYFVWLGLKWVWQRLKVEANRTRLSVENIKVPINRNVLLFMGVLSAATCIVVYNNQWSEWKTEENAHPEAKTYFVAGQVVRGIRTLLMDVFHPDNPVLYPAKILQQWIYRAGSGLLPEDDGEKAIWMDLWFLAPYTRELKLPSGVSRFEASPRMIPFLDKIWWTLKTVSEKPIADPKMRVEQYFRNFPGMLFYYCLYEGYYTGNNWGSGDRLAKDLRHRARSERIVSWIHEYREKIKGNPYIQDFLESNPKVEAVLQTCLILELQDLFRTDLLSGEFTCGKPYIRQYVDEMRRFAVGNSDGISPYLKMKIDEKVEKQGAVLYDIVYDNTSSRFMMYVLNEMCGEKFFLTRDEILADDGRPAMLERFEAVFGEEISILREIDYPALQEAFSVREPERGIGWDQRIFKKNPDRIEDIHFFDMMTRYANPARLENGP